MNHALDESLDDLNWHHTSDCAAVESAHAECDCNDQEDACAA